MSVRQITDAGPAVDRRVHAAVAGLAPDARRLGCALALLAPDARLHDAAVAAGLPAPRPAGAAPHPVAGGAPPGRAGTEAPHTVAGGAPPGRAGTDDGVPAADVARSSDAAATPDVLALLDALVGAGLARPDGRGVTTTAGRALLAAAPPGELTALRHRAARRVEDPRRAAALLVPAIPLGDEAAADLLGRGAAALEAVDRPRAVMLLRRAVEEAPRAAAAAERRLRIAELVAADDARAGVAALDAEVATLPPGTALHARAVAALGRAHLRTGDTTAAADLLASVAGERRNRDDAPAEIVGLLADLLTARSLDIERPDEVPALLRPWAVRAQRGDGAARLLRAIEAFWLVQGGEPAAAVRAARAALGDDGLWGTTGTDRLEAHGAVHALFTAERLLEALAAASAMVTAAERTRDAAALAGARGVRATVLLRLGRLREAEADARTALGGHGLSHPQVHAALATARLWRGRPDEAGTALDDVAPGPWSGGVLEHTLLEARGRLLRERGDAAAAAVVLQEAGARLCRHGGEVSLLSDWRAEAALALSAAGDLDAARTLAGRQLELAERQGLSRARSLGLRALATTEGGDARVGRLHEAAALRGGGDPLEHARALLALGVALRRRREERDARAPLREALHLADCCGADGLAADTREELLASGARPRRPRTTGTDSLTHTEARVARLAAAGATNRDIATALVVSHKTVETHLGHVYRKLGIPGRAGLAAALDAA